MYRHAVPEQGKQSIWETAEVGMTTDARLWVQLNVAEYLDEQTFKQKHTPNFDFVTPVWAISGRSHIVITTQKSYFLDHPPICNAIEI